MRADFVRSRKDHHLVADGDVIADINWGAEIEKAVDIEPAALPNRELAVQISAAGNCRCPPHHTARPNLKSSETENIYPYAAPNVKRQKCQEHPRQKEPEVETI